MAPIFSSIKALVVDENPEDRYHCCAILEQYGCEVRACASFKEASQALEKEVFDLIVVDQGSAAFEGRFVLERALKGNPRLPILVSARFHDVQCYLDAMWIGARDYAEKPIDAKDLFPMVRSIQVSRKQPA